MASYSSFDGNEGDAVISLRRRAFDEGRLPFLLTSATHLDIQFHNDVYAKVRWILILSVQDYSDDLTTG